jgi:hypothetical protein
MLQFLDGRRFCLSADPFDQSAGLAPRGATATRCGRATAYSWGFYRKVRSTSCPLSIKRIDREMAAQYADMATADLWRPCARCRSQSTAPCDDLFVTVLSWRFLRSYPCVINGTNSGTPNGWQPNLRQGCARTREAFSFRFNLDRFRHAAATFWSIHDPANARNAKDLLGHSSSVKGGRTFVAPLKRRDPPLYPPLIGGPKSVPPRRPPRSWRQKLTPQGTPPQL